MPDTTTIQPFLDAEHGAIAREVAAFASEQVAVLPLPHDDAAAQTTTAPSRDARDAR